MTETELKMVRDARGLAQAARRNGNATGGAFLDKMADTLEAAANRPTKRTSPEVSAIASRRMRDPSPFLLLEKRQQLAREMIGSGVDKQIAAVERMLIPYLDDLKALAASVLSQDEVKGS